VVRKAVEAIEGHPNYIRRGVNATDQRHDFILHTHGDAQRAVQLALLPFSVTVAQAKATG